MHLIELLHGWWLQLLTHFPLILLILLLLPLPCPLPPLLALSSAHSTAFALVTLGRSAASKWWHQDPCVHCFTGCLLWSQSLFVFWLVLPNWHSSSWSIYSLHQFCWTNWSIWPCPWQLIQCLLQSGCSSICSTPGWGLQARLPILGFFSNKGQAANHQPSLSLLTRPVTWLAGIFYFALLRWWPVLHWLSQYPGTWYSVPGIP